MVAVLTITGLCIGSLIHSMITGLPINTELMVGEALGIASYAAILKFVWGK